MSRGRKSPLPPKPNQPAEGPLLQPSLSLNLVQPQEPLCTSSSQGLLLSVLTPVLASSPLHLFQPQFPPPVPSSARESCTSSSPRPICICCSQGTLSLDLRQPGGLSVTHQLTTHHLSFIQPGRRALSGTAPATSPLSQLQPQSPLALISSSPRTPTSPRAASVLGTGPNSNSRTETCQL